VTKDELIEAVRLVVNDDKTVNALLRSVTLPYVVKAAAEKAFIEEMTGPYVEIVREAMRMLWYPPERLVFEEPEEDDMCIL
jgi:hypothetical protein